MVGHLLPDEAYAAVSAGARAAMGLEPVSIAAGSPAELLAVRAATFREAIATAHPDRLVYHRGRLVAQTRSTTVVRRHAPPTQSVHMTDAVPTSAVPRVPGVETLAPEADTNAPGARRLSRLRQHLQGVPRRHRRAHQRHLRRAPGEFVTVVGPRAAASRRCCGSRRASPDARRASSGSTATASATCSRTRRCCSGAPSAATSSCSRSCTASARPSAAGSPRRRSTSSGSTGFEDKYPKQLSGGMRMRASLARSLTLKPERVPVRRAVRCARRDHP